MTDVSVARQRRGNSRGPWTLTRQTEEALKAEAGFDRLAESAE